MCSLEFPDLETSFWQKYKDQGLLVWGIAQGGLRSGDTDEILREFVAQTQVTFLVARDRDGGYNRFRGALTESQVSPFPLDVLIDSEGRLVSVRGEYDPGALTREVEGLLGP